MDDADQSPLTPEELARFTAAKPSWLTPDFQLFPDLPPPEFAAAKFDLPERRRAAIPAPNPDMEMGASQGGTEPPCHCSSGGGGGGP